MECWVFPEHTDEELNKINPNFDHCETLYTKCDYALEACVHEQLMKLEKELRAHQVLLGREIKLQNKLIDRLWVLSQRYLLLTRSGVCVKPYPEVVSEPTEQRVLCEFHEKLTALRLSNCRLSSSLVNIRESLNTLEYRYKQLDVTVPSIFIRGSVTHKPFSYSREIVYDLYNYFYGTLCKLKCWAQLIDPGDSAAIEDYIALAKSVGDNENNLMIGIKNCTCMRTNNPNCLTEES